MSEARSVHPPAAATSTSGRPLRAVAQPRRYRIDTYDVATGRAVSRITCPLGTLAPGLVTADGRHLVVDAGNQTTVVLRLAGAGAP